MFVYFASRAGADHCKPKPIHSPDSSSSVRKSRECWNSALHTTDDNDHRLDETTDDADHRNAERSHNTDDMRLNHKSSDTLPSPCESGSDEHNKLCHNKHDSRNSTEDSYVPNSSRYSNSVQRNRTLADDDQPNAYDSTHQRYSSPDSSQRQNVTIQDKPAQHSAALHTAASHTAAQQSFLYKWQINVSNTNQVMTRSS